MQKFNFQVLLLISVATLSCCEAFVRLSSSRSFGLQHLNSSPPSGMQNFIAWSPLTPNTFDEDDITLDGCQIAKDKEYLGAILKQWNAEERSLEVETQPYEYKDDEGNLFGRLVRRTKSEEADKNSLPGILLFHTGAGPLDVSLFYKAESLAQKFDCVVLICDIVSDCYGWGWREDRTHMSEIQDSLMADDASFLRLRATSAAEALSSVPEVDPQRLAAIGWCLGGQPILELGRVKSAAYSIRAMATFHGVFQRDELAPVLTDESPSSESASGGTVLICNGKDDPFVSAKDLEDSKNCFEANGWTVDLQQYEGAKHGFSNPAQEFNKDPAFGYNEEVATKSWDATLQLLEKQLF